MTSGCANRAANHSGVAPINSGSSCSLWMFVVRASTSSEAHSDWRHVQERANHPGAAMHDRRMNRTEACFISAGVRTFVEEELHQVFVIGVCSHRCPH